MTRNELLVQIKKGNFKILDQLPGLSSDSSLMLEAFQLNEGVINYIDPSLIKTESFFYELALINPEIIKGTEYAEKKDFIKKIVSEIPEAARYMGKRLYNDPVFVVEIATSGAESIVIEKMENDPEIHNILQRLAFDEYKYVDDYEVSRQNEMIERGEITEELSNNVEFMTKAIGRNIEYIYKIGEELILDRNKFNEVYRGNKDNFLTYVEIERNKVLKSQEGRDAIKNYLETSNAWEESRAKMVAEIKQNQKANEEQKQEQSQDKSQEQSQEKSQEQTKAQTKGNSPVFYNKEYFLVKATLNATQDECLNILIEDWEEKLEKKMGEAVNASDPEKRAKAEKGIKALTTAINDAKEKMKTPEGRAELLEKYENNPVLQNAQRQKEKELFATLPRSGPVDYMEGVLTIMNRSASVKSIDDKFKNVFRGVRGEIGYEKHDKGEKKVSNLLKYFIENPEEFDRLAKTPGEKELFLQFVEARKRAEERGRNGRVDSLSTEGNTLAAIRGDLVSVAIDVLKEQEENLEQEMKLATDEEKEKLHAELKGVRTKIKNLGKGKSIDKTVKDLIRQTGNEELKKARLDEIHATTVDVAQKIKNGEYVTEEELRKAANDSNRSFEEECPELCEKVKAKMIAENPGNKTKPVLEYLVKNRKLLDELIPKENENERINAGRWMQPFEVVQTTIEGRNEKYNKAETPIQKTTEDKEK